MNAKLDLQGDRRDAPLRLTRESHEAVQDALMMSATNPATPLDLLRAVACSLPPFDWSSLVDILPKARPTARVLPARPSQSFKAVLWRAAGGRDGEADITRWDLLRALARLPEIEAAVRLSIEEWLARNGPVREVARDPEQQRATIFTSSAGLPGHRFAIPGRNEG